jgi:uncharacterized MnhB-related membrane protein
MNVATILLVIYALAVIWLGGEGHVWAAIGVGVGGLLLLTLFSLCWAADKGDRDMEKIARGMYESKGS